MSYRSSISWRSFSEKDGLGSKELCGPDGVAKEFPKWAKTQKAPANTLKTNYYSKRFLIVDSENAIIVVPEGTSEADARKKWNDSFKLFVLRDPKDNGKIVETRYTFETANALSPNELKQKDCGSVKGKYGVPDDPKDPNEDSDSEEEEDAPAPAAAVAAAAPPNTPFPGGCNISGHWPGNIRGESLTQAESYTVFFNGECEINIHTKTCPTAMKNALASHLRKVNQGYGFFGEELARHGSAVGTIPSCVAAMCRGGLKMYKANTLDKHGLVCSFSHGTRCLVTITSLMEMEQGWMIAKPISTMVPHGWSETIVGGAKVYHIVGPPCRLSMATHGSRGSLISRSSKGYGTESIQDRQRTLSIMALDEIRNHPQLVGPRDPNNPMRSGFSSLSNGEAWKTSSRKVLYKGLESQFAAHYTIARERRVGHGNWRSIDCVSTAMAPEDEILPGNCIVFSACRNSGNGLGAFNGNGNRRDEMPGATAGERKPVQYWEVMLPYRKRYYGDTKFQSYGSPDAKSLAAEAGAAVKQMGWPVYIAIYTNGHLRYFRLFPDYVDYLCYFDLKVWQSIVRYPQHRWPQPIQA